MIYLGYFGDITVNKHPDGSVSVTFWKKLLWRNSETDIFHVETACQKSTSDKWFCNPYSILCPLKTMRIEPTRFCSSQLLQLPTYFGQQTSAVHLPTPLDTAELPKVRVLFGTTFRSQLVQRTLSENCPEGSSVKFM